MSRAAESKKAEIWRGRIREAARSGLSTREFCRRRNLKESQFYWWQRRLKESRPRTARSQAEPGASCALISEEGGAVDAGIELMLAGGRRLRISRGVDEATLRSVLAVIEGAGC